MAEIFISCGLIGGGILGLTWLVYPATIGAISIFFPRRTAEPRSEVPRVSFVLATREPPEDVRRRVDDVFRASYPNGKLEVVVSLDPSSRFSPSDYSDLKAYPKVQVVQGSVGRGKAAALNEGVERASGELLVFSDTHQRFAPEAIRELVSVFSDPSVAGASGNLIIGRARGHHSVLSWYWEFEKWLRAREARIHSPVGVTGAISCMRTFLWQPLPVGLILDDLYTPMRLVLEGHRVAFVHSAKAYETRMPTPHQEHLRKTRTLTGVLQLCLWLPDTLIPWKTPLFLQFLFHKVFRLLTPYSACLVVVWAGWMLWSRVPWVLPAIFVVLGMVSVWTVVGWPKEGKKLRALFLELLLTQVAVFKATVNGLRGRWDVWE